jgi:hypothetical protein
VDKICVEPQASPEIPSEYVRSANGNFYYVSQEELPWPRAQYECLAKKGYLAELTGKVLNLFLFINLNIDVFF